MSRADATLGFGSSWTVRRVAETGSTNADLLAAARDGAPAGSVIVTDHQTAGRGRLDRTWIAPPGSSLLVSILARPALPSSLYHRLTQAVALAGRAAASAVAGVVPDLKWPNDLLVRGGKLAGILAEAPGPGAVVIGMGMNLNWPAEHLPDGATSLSVELGRAVDRDDMLDALLDALAQLDLPAVEQQYRAALVTLGQRVRVEMPHGSTFEGLAVDAHAHGLVVRTDDGQDRVVSAGDVVHVRPVTDRGHGRRGG